mmetsp:Transcript_42189/g.75546  ORF Transcript_42189/g.75546 Transcript_42189/m.75546 type:complete len:212 (+) Transcript_42189:55-690(+)
MQVLVRLMLCLFCRSHASQEQMTNAIARNSKPEDRQQSWGLRVQVEMKHLQRNTQAVIPKSSKAFALLLLTFELPSGWQMPPPSSASAWKERHSNSFGHDVTSALSVHGTHCGRVGSPPSLEFDEEEPLSQKERLRRSLRESAKFKVKNDARFAWFSIGAVCASYAGYSYDGTAPLINNFNALLGGLGTLVSALLFFLPELLAVRRSAKKK